MRRIPLRGRNGSVRAYALVDDADFEWVNGWRWCLSHGYAKRNVPGRGADGSRTQRLLGMHRQIMGDPPRMEVDHLDGDRLNNQRANLRVVTPAQNRQNLRVRRDSQSGVRGVTWHKSMGKWCVQLYFDDLDEAKETIEAWRAKHMPFSKEAISAAV